MEDQPQRVSDKNKIVSLAHAGPVQDDQRFHDWVAQARSSNDIRSRIAVAGSNITRGRFGKFHLIAAHESVDVSFCDSTQASALSEETAANDEAFEQMLPVQNLRS